jgi:endonuclease YncB( thermonuclease family)
MICAVLGLCATLVGAPSVHDGDTLTIQGQAVRLFGIDAEELDEPNGPRARDALRALVRGTSHVRCELTGERTYNRVVGVCYTAAGEDLGEAMVRGGFALDCGRYSDYAYRPFEPMAIRRTLKQKPYCRSKS